jgi:glycosyltransferase involved in cell wall biosynthesis
VISEAARVINVTICAYDKPDNVGGPVSWIRRLVPLLRDRGIEARCLFIMHWGDTGPALTPLREAGFECRSTTLDRTEDRVRWILDDLGDNPPDVFVPNLVVAAYHAARWARAAGIPTVGILHSDDAFYRALQSEFVFGATENRLDAIVCVSRQLEDEVNQKHPGDTIVRRIPYGVSIPSESVSRSPAGLRLAYAGRLTEAQKRITDVVRALSSAIQGVPGTSASIYGDGPDRSKVERMIASGPAAGGRPVLEGLVDSERMQERLLSADVIVLLSEYEGLPIALLEAMACGCVPVCLRGRSGIPELVTHEVTGLLVDDRDSDFVAAIRRLSEDIGLWSRLSIAARERARSFSADSSADAWASLFQQLASSRRPVQLNVPDALALPPVHPDLASADRRTFHPRGLARVASRSRMLLGRLKRALLD